MRDETFRDEWPTFFLALFLVGCSCAHVPPAPAGNLDVLGLQRLYQVAPHLYRSAQPNAAQFAALAERYQIDTDIKLNYSIEGEDELTGSLISLAYQPWLGLGPVEHEDVDRVEDLIAECLSRKGAYACLVHCEHGQDRTGLAIALMRVRRGWTPKRAFDEWVAYGSNRLKLLEETFYKETGWRP